MKKLLLIVSVCILSIVSFSQDSKAITVNKIKVFMKQYSVKPGASIPIGENFVIYFNNADKILDIEGYQIPLLEVKTAYSLSKIADGHYVSFDCKSEDCIKYPNGGYGVGFSMAFLTKKNCYDFIELISQLKR